MKKAQSNLRPNSNAGQAEKAFYKRIEQDYFLIRKIARDRYNPDGIEPIIATRIERIQYALTVCKYIQAKLQELLQKYQALLPIIQE